jgi:hypothetical protein
MGKPAAKQGDKVVSIDTHVVTTPSPGGPVPTPTPIPFNGVLSGNLSSSVLIENKPAATEGSTADNTPAHLPAGGAFLAGPAPLEDDRQMATGADKLYVLTVGAHTARFEPPDLYIFTRVGTVSAAEHARVAEELSRFAQGKRWVFAIVHVVSMGSASVEARRVVERRILPLLSAAAYILSNPAHRMALAALYRPSGTPVAFVETEAEARAWVDAQRRMLEAGAGAPPRRSRPPGSAM